MSIWWLYFLVFFYHQNNYLARLPLSRKDFRNVILFRSFLKTYPVFFINYSFIKQLRECLDLVEYNDYKHNYLIIRRLLPYFNILNFFLKTDDNFLKFIFFKKKMCVSKILLFYILNFYKLVVSEFNEHTLTPVFLSCFYFVFSKKKLIINTYELKNYNMYELYSLLFLKKKIFFKNYNPFSKELKLLISYFDNLWRLEFFHVSRVYTKMWSRRHVAIYEFWAIASKNIDQLTTFLEKFKYPTFPLKINNNFKKFLEFYWPVRYENYNFSKFIDYKNNENYTIFFLRKNKIFNKGRYSRNRQIYRTGVYMCLYINVIFVYFYIFSFYKFTFNFGFFWYGIGIFILAMTFSRAARYRFYNVGALIKEIVDFFKWLSLFFFNGWRQLIIIYKYVLLFLKKYVE